MELIRATQQFALLTRETLRRYMELGDAEYHEETRRIAGDLLSLVPFAQPVDSSRAALAPLAQTISDRLFRGGVLWLAARGFELTAGLLSDVDQVCVAVRDSTLAYTLTGNDKDVLRVLIRHGECVRQPDCGARVTALQAVLHALDGRSGVARRMLREPLSADHPISPSARTDVALAATYVEILDQHFDQARQLARTAAFLCGNDVNRATAEGMRAWATLALQGEATWQAPPFDSARAYPFLAAYVVALRLGSQLGPMPSLQAIETAVAEEIARSTGHWMRGIILGVASGCVHQFGGAGQAARYRRIAADELYAGGVRIGRSARFLEQAYGVGARLGDALLSPSATLTG